MSRLSIEALFKKFLGEQMSTRELRQLQEYVQDEKNSETLDRLLEEAYRDKSLAVKGDHDPEKIFLEWKEKAGFAVHVDNPSFSVAPVHRIQFLKRWWWAAASVLLLVCAGIYFWPKEIQQDKIVETIAPPAEIKDVSPGGNKAVLTLGDGSTIILDEAKDGELAKQGNARIVKLANGQLSYTVAGASSNEVFYNTMSTPRGGQYQLTLPDGTGVWLNAASSITYPSAFVGDERKVTISGEAYLEVAKDKSKPFRVLVNDMTIDVLGTDFNVNAYQDESSIKTTLVQGSIKVIAGDRLQMVSPGQQAQLDRKGDVKLLAKADVEQAVAWKNGLFHFNNADLPAVMKQLARWYNVDVDFAGETPKGVFNGKIGRSLTLAQVLKVLSKTRVNYRIENGRRIIIMP